MPGRYFNYIDLYRRGMTIYHGIRSETYVRSSVVKKYILSLVVVALVLVGAAAGANKMITSTSRSCFYVQKGEGSGELSVNPTGGRKICIVGKRGAKGSKGVQGAQGTAGTNGTNGTNGAKGDTGATGAIGPQGPKGDTGATGATGEQGPIGPQGEPGIPAPTPQYAEGAVLVSRGGAPAAIWATDSTALGSPLPGLGDTASGTFRFTCSAVKAPCVVTLQAAATEAGVSVYPRILIYKSDINSGQVFGQCEYGDGADNNGSYEPVGNGTLDPLTVGIGGTLDCGSDQVYPTNGVASEIDVPAGYYDVFTTFYFKTNSGS